MMYKHGYTSGDRLVKKLIGEYQRGMLADLPEDYKKEDEKSMWYMARMLDAICVYKDPPMWVFDSDVELQWNKDRNNYMCVSMENDGRALYIGRIKGNKVMGRFVYNRPPEVVKVAARGF